MNTSHHLAMAEDAHPRRGRSRLTLNEQLRFFGAANEPRPPEKSVGSWAVLALALAAAIFGCAAAGFAAYAILVALGEEHRVAGSALIAGCFALLSGIAALLARGRRSG